MSLFGKIVNSYCDHAARQADDLMSKGKIKLRDAKRSGNWDEKKQAQYDEIMSNLQEKKDFANCTKDYYNHFHDDDY